MATAAVVTPNSSKDRSSRFNLVSWINNLLKTDFKDVQEMGSGACHCQLMDWVRPGSVDMTKVKFDAQGEDDCKHNYSLLHEAFSKSGITRTIPVEELIKGDFKSSFEMLKWFKVFCNENVKSSEYDPVKARDGRVISPRVLPSKSDKGSSRLNSELEENGTEMSKRFLYSDKWKETFTWAERSTLGDAFTYCRTCAKNLNTQHKGMFVLRRHVETKKHKEGVQISKRAVMQSRRAEQVSCSDAAVRFIHKYCHNDSTKGQQVTRFFARRKLGMQYPRNITSVCQHTPYCVYIYGGVTGGNDETVTVVLVGFFDVEACRHRICFLDALQSVDDGAEDQAASVGDTLKKFGLPADNLVAVHFSGLGVASEQICSQLRELNPNITVLGGLYTVADASCHAGVKQLSNQAEELMADIHAHYSSCSMKNDNLKALFGADVTADSPAFSINTSCLNFCRLVTNILEIWTDLISYFSSCDKDDDKAKSICSQLQDPKVRATFMFLEQALKPLLSFQKHLETQEGVSRADLLLILEEASNLICTYTSYFLHPQAAARFLKERDAKILKNKKFHLSNPELYLGGEAVENLMKESEVAEALSLLNGEVLSFYISLTCCISEELPLSDGLLRSIAQLLNPQSRLKVTGKAVGELGSKLGICSSPEEVNQLKEEFLEYQLAEEGKGEGEGEGEDGEENKSVAVPLENHWSSVLKDTKLTAFRRLVLTLLALPCPSLDTQQVFTQALENKDAALLSESEALSDSEGDTASDSTHSDTKELNGLDVVVKSCEVRLTKLKHPWNGFDGMSGENGAFLKEGTGRGCYGWESSLRQKPQARTVFQAGVSTWSKPVFDKDSKNDRESQDEVDGKGFLTGELIWGKVKGFSWWPGMVMPWKTKSSPPGMRKVEWFGDGMFSEIYTDGLVPFSAFTKCFCKNSFVSLPVYKEAIFQIIELAGERCGKSFAAAGGNKEKELKLMVDWALEGFLPTGPEGFVPPDSAAHLDASDSSQSDYQPPPKRKYIVKNSKANASAITYSRESIREKVKEKGRTIEDFCLSCGSTEIEVAHPLFEGGLCLKCKILVGPGTFDKMKDVDPWNCYMCRPSQCEGNLKLRPDWSVKVQDLFVNNSAMEFEPHRVYPSIPADKRRPIKVLSLFDGIATGYLVLRDLGFKIERYIASEICDDSIAVGMIKHEGKIEYVNDVRAITRKHLAEWGPFDLLIGGSPCNDLSMVNPLRKGLFAPSCNPILIDAVKVSPANRARYFWGNVPGMNRPVATSLDDKLTLQDCLEVGRVAKFDKVRTITTKSNSIRQGKMGPLPVSMNGKEDYLWCTEMEQVFGFPKHYTDVNNMGRMQRQRVLGRSWSVPVIRHLFAPLKDYFECE
ncbi:hypothetical protein INR49_003521 [Caranx melampygus]|nr:hypothetical protein INR49_003521 [Caranx melampygus]